MLKIEVDNQIAPKINEMISQTIPESRQNAMNSAMGAVLMRTIEETPVDTGRSRTAWQASRQGNGKLGNGQSTEGFSSKYHSLTITEIRATNAVPYISYLEYGTSKIPPFAMVRKALATIRSSLPSLFKIRD